MGKKKRFKALRSRAKRAKGPDRFAQLMIPGNGVTLLVDGAQAYSAMLKAIADAQRTILMDSYIFHNDAAGQLFFDALSERALAGVAVYLIVDGVGTLNVPSKFLLELENNRVNVLTYRPVAPWRRGWGLLRRDHRKLLVVDNRIGFAGGVNVGEEWLPEELGGKGWHDIHVRVEGPAASELSRLCISTWKVHAGVDLDPRLFLTPAEPVGEQAVAIIGSRERKKRKAIRRSYLRAIRRAQQYIYIANAYFLPDIGFRRALRNAIARGVDVRVMVPAKGDILPVQLASQVLFAPMLRRGIRIFLREDAVLHAKSAVIDDQWATVGSFNIDHRSWAMNLEVNVNILGPEFSSELKQVFLNGQADCRELSLVSWKQRSIWLRFWEQFCYLFRRVM